MKLTSNEICKLWHNSNIKRLHDKGYNRWEEWIDIGTYFAPYHDVTVYKNKITGEIRIDEYYIGD